MAINIGRLSNQVGYIFCDILSLFLIPSILVAVCLPFAVKGHLHVRKLAYKDGTEEQVQEFHSRPFSHVPGKQVHAKTKMPTVKSAGKNRL